MLGALDRQVTFGAVVGSRGIFNPRLAAEGRRLLRAYAGEGEFTDDPFPMDGGIAVCRIAGLRRLLDHVTRQGFPHHVAMARGRWADVIEEATTRYLGWDLHRHGDGRSPAWAGSTAPWPRPGSTIRRSCRRT